MTHECGFTFAAMKEHYFDDLKVGDGFKSESLSVTEKQLIEFAEAPEAHGQRHGPPGYLRVRAQGRVGREGDILPPPGQIKKSLDALPKPQSF